MKRDEREMRSKVTQNKEQAMGRRAHVAESRSRSGTYDTACYVGGETVKVMIAAQRRVE